MHDHALKPILEPRFAELLAPFAPLADTIAVAVSGGPDSMALAFCVGRWAAAAHKSCVALIVDHGLRPESAAEAETVLSRLQQLGLSGEILRWQHDAVTGRIHEKARAARYRLLVDACKKRGVADLLTAHHREDQAETILMRLSKGSGIDGLAGMSPASVRDGVRLLRPFLSLSKQALIATCDAAHIPYVTDPSNSSGKFARARLRKIMPLLASEGMSTDSLLDLGDRAREAADAIDFYARAFLTLHARFEIGGSIRCDRAALAAAPRATAARALSLSLRHIHIADYPPERDGIADLLDLIADPHSETVRSFYGCLVSISEKHLHLLREPAAATEIRPLSNTQPVLWDGRWIVTYTGKDIADLYIRALGAAPHDQIDKLAPTLRRHIPQGRIRATLPALWRGQTLLGIPSFDPTAAFRLAYAKQAFPSPAK
jgi:tRNA(Ile)-lysidine synthase